MSHEDEIDSAAGLNLNESELLVNKTWKMVKETL